MKRFPARLHVLLARDGPLAVVIRRGPAEKTATFLWNRAKDTFKLGQWMKGRLYERRCDLSPSGRYLIYFARNFSRLHAETKGTWTALSIAPYLKAIKLWGKGNCWQGGGLFTGPRTYWLNGCDHFLVRNESELRLDKTFDPLVYYNGECPGVYYLRLQRDGWQLVTKLGAMYDSCAVFEKRLRNGTILRKIAHEQIGAPPGKGCYWDEHEIERKGSRVEYPDWEWAEWIDGSLYYAEHGCLWRRDLSSGKAELLHDFNAWKYEEIIAPY
jgi:hypothetical protein